MGNCTRWHVMKVAEMLRRNWNRDQLRASPSIRTPQDGFGLCEEQGSYWKTHHSLGESLKPNLCSKEHFCSFLPQPVSSAQSQAQTGGSRCRAEDGDKLPIASDWWWQTHYVVPKSQQWHVPHLASEGHCCPTCRDMQTERRVKHTVFLLQRAFPSHTKYSSRCKWLSCSSQGQLGHREVWRWLFLSLCSQLLPSHYGQG